MHPARLALIGPALAGILVCGLAAQTASGQAPVTLRYGQNKASARSVSSLDLNVALRKGFLSAEGIRLEIVPAESSTYEPIENLNKGKSEITRTDLIYQILDDLKGSDNVAIASELPAKTSYSLMVKPGITSYADLTGKLIALSTPVDTITITMQKLLALNGLAPADYRTIEDDTSVGRASCLTSGRCDAAAVGQPNDFELLDRNLGYRRLGDTSQALRDFQFNVTAVNRAWGVAHKDTLVRFVRAWAQSFRFIHDPANRGEVATILAGSTGFPEQVAREVLAFYLDGGDKGIVPRQAELNVKGVGEMIAIMAQAGVLKPPLPAADRFVDLQYLAAAGVR
jgi:ABC-type nitrate/sulfonate/bicarbonate transport system substrate-binding protein